MNLLPPQIASQIDRVKHELRAQPTVEHVEWVLEPQEGARECGLHINEFLPVTQKLNINTNGVKGAYYVPLWKDSDDRLYLRLSSRGKNLDVFLQDR